LRRSLESALTTMALHPTGRGRRRWTNRWKAALSAFEITFDGRLSARPEAIPSRSFTPLS